MSKVDLQAECRAVGTEVSRPAVVQNLSKRLLWKEAH